MDFVRGWRGARRAAVGIGTGTIAIVRRCNPGGEGRGCGSRTGADCSCEVAADGLAGESLTLRAAAGPLSAIGNETSVTLFGVCEFNWCAMGIVARDLTIFGR